MHSQPALNGRAHVAIISPANKKLLQHFLHSIVVSFFRYEDESIFRPFIPIFIVQQ